MPTTIGQPVTSLQYLRYAISVTQGSVPHDPTGDLVQFGFVPTSNRADTSPVSYIAGGWEIDTSNGQTQYVARILVGPGGSFVPSAQTSYWVWIRITDNPEVPVIQAGILKVT